MHSPCCPARRPTFSDHGPSAGYRSGATRGSVSGIQLASSVWRATPRTFGPSTGHRRRRPMSRMTAARAAVEILKVEAVTHFRPCRLSEGVPWQHNTLTFPRDRVSP
jgi:hypothetical protein